MTVGIFGHAPNILERDDIWLVVHRNDLGQPIVTSVHASERRAQDHVKQYRRTSMAMHVGEYRREHAALRAAQKLGWLT